MKITKVQPLLVDRFCFVRIETDAGITGIGESGAWGQLEASAAAMTKYGEYLVGRDPSPIEHHWNVMLRANHFSGSAINGAVSAIDIALWDIKGKALGVPVHELLGGQVRGKARVYAHLKGRTIEQLIDESKRLKAAGFNALGHFNPLLNEDESVPYFKTHASKIEQAIDNVRRVREAVGPEVDLCVEIHRRLTPPEAIALARGIERYMPMFYEDPIRPDNYDAMGWVADHIPIPVATGERFISLFQFQNLLARRGVQYLRPDVCMCGGITAVKKIAALAEANDTMIVPHNPLSPVSTAACLQIAACIPNFAIQEYPSGTPGIDKDGDLLGDKIAVGLAQQESGFVPIPSVPGIGVELGEDAERRFPYKPRPVQMRPHVDGSFVEQ
jgi:galactonate dehydratase